MKSPIQPSYDKSTLLLSCGVQVKEDFVGLYILAQYKPCCTEREPSVHLHIQTNKDLQNQIVMNVIVVCSLGRSNNLKFSWGLYSKLSSSFCQI